MALQWQGTWGYDGGFLAATIARYDRSTLSDPGPDGLRQHEVTGSYYAVFVSQVRIPGEYDTLDEAKAAADHYYVQSSSGP